MLLKKILQQTSASPNVVFRDPFKPVDTDSIIQEVIGMANLNFDGARYIVFGINKAGMQGSGIVGIDEQKLATLKEAHQLISTLVKPALQLAFIYDEIDGKLAGALEIDGCNERPYTVACDFSDTLTIGQAWTRDGMLFRAVDAGELEKMRPDQGNPEEWRIALGLGTNPETTHAELKVPDSSNPPSERTDQQKSLKKVDWKQATVEAIGTINTNIARLMQTGRRRAPTTESTDQEAIEFFQKDAERRVSEADNYYYFEECAVRLQLRLRNDDVVMLEDLELSLGFPRVDGLTIVERVCPAPNGTTDPMDAACYPTVRVLEKGVVAIVKVGNVEPNTNCAIFSSPLRLAVAPKLLGRKMAIDCKLKAKNKDLIERIRLTVSFAPVAAAETAPTAQPIPAS